MPRPRGWTTLLAALLLGALPAKAQLVGAASSGSRVPLQAAATGRTLADAPLRSLVVPGWGQLELGQRRGWAYLALEAAGWAIFIDRHRGGASLRNDYRDLAWTTARLQSGTRVDGDFAYYERLSKWTRSGAFDGDPERLGIQPEEDPTAFNGSIWALARSIYGVPATGAQPDDPGYERALAYYVARAYGPELLWDWTSAPGEQEAFTGLISASDDRFRQATTALGALIANHLVSAIDAYISGSTEGRRAPLSVWAEPTRAGTRWSAFAHIEVF
jgi:hypothetical protein